MSQRLATSITAVALRVRRSQALHPTSILAFPPQPWDVIQEATEPMDQEDAKRICERENIDALVSHSSTSSIAVRPPVCIIRN